MVKEKEKREPLEIYWVYVHSYELKTKTLNRAFCVGKMTRRTGRQATYHLFLWRSNMACSIISYFTRLYGICALAHLHLPWADNDTTNIPYLISLHIIVRERRHPIFLVVSVPLPACSSTCLPVWRRKPRDRMTHYAMLHWDTRLRLYTVGCCRCTPAILPLPRYSDRCQWRAFWREGRAGLWEESPLILPSSVLLWEKVWGGLGTALQERCHPSPTIM